MKIKCDYCGAFIDDTDEKCSNCGAVNNHLKRSAIGIPKTIEELKQWYIEHNLPDENITRFFIGKDYKNPRAFGIYKDEVTGNFVVYKNKDTGVRSIRYEGKDEAYAVNELYMKLKEEIVNQKQHNVNRNNRNKKKKFRINWLTVIIIYFIIYFLLFFLISIFSPHRGYYSYEDNYYYYQSGYWYEYDDYDGWYKTSAPEELKDNYKDYYESSSYSSYYGIDDFEDSGYYSSGSSSDDWDSSSSWDSDSSWDSSSSDWSSDW
jgi:hypothetical protein